MLKGLLFSCLGLLIVGVFLLCKAEKKRAPKTIAHAPASLSSTKIEERSLELETISLLKTKNDKKTQLSLEELEQKIKNIDREIIDNNYVELANQEALTSADMLRFKTLLGARDKLFEMKVALLLNDA